MGRTIALAAIVGVVLHGAAFQSSARQGVATASAPTTAAIRAPVLGTWRLVSPAGQSGYLAYDPAGYMSLSVQGSGRRAIAGAQPTTGDMRNALETYVGQWGTFLVSPSAGVVTHQTFGTVDPATSGLNLAHRYRLSRGRLALDPAPEDRAARGWERLPDLPALTPTHRKLIAFWKLVAWERRHPTGDVEALRPGQTGFIVYTASGHIMVHMMDAYRRRNAGGAPTPEETTATYRTYTGYFGAYSVNESEGYVVHHIEGTMNSGAVGTDFLRHLEFVGRRLILRPPVTKTPDGDVQTTLTWERLDD